jgi:YfiH family protein
MQKLFITHPAYNPASITYGFVGKQNSWRVDNRQDDTSKQVSFLTQVRGNKCVCIDLKEQVGQLPEADAQVTTLPGIVLAVRVADCVPIILIDEVHKVVGVVHAGWRGALTGVIANSIAAMQSKGSKPNNIKAIIGPCIRQSSYEVRADLLDKFLDESQDNMQFFTRKSPEHWLFDLPGYVKHKLYQAGITNVLDVEMDTFTDEDNFWSCRREFLRGRKHDGHVLGIVGIKS